MDGIPTKEDLDAKAKETHDLWSAALEAKRIAAACEEEFKNMRYRYYLAKTLAIDVILTEAKKHE